MAVRANNPFEATQPARGYFVGRESELLELRGYLEDISSGGATNLYIVGGGGAGKTSFLDKASEEAALFQLIAVSVTLSDDMQSDDLIIHLIKALFKKVSTQYDLPEYYADFGKGLASTLFETAVEYGNKKPISIPALVHDLEYLLEIFNKVNVKGALLCIDEGQRLRQINGGAALAKLRGAIQSATIGRGFMIILAALEDVITDISKHYTGVDRFFPKQILLGPFENSNTAIEAVEKRLRNKPIAFPHNVSEQIVEIAELYPKHIIDICHDVFAEAVTAKVDAATLEMINKVVYHRYQNDVIAIKEGLNSLLPKVLETLRKMLVIGTACTSKDVAQAYCRGNDVECVSRMQPAVLSEINVLVAHDFCVLIRQEVDDSLFELTRGVRRYLIESELGIVKRTN